MNDAVQLWADPRLVYPVAVFAAALLLASIYLFRRRRREGRQAGAICLILAVSLHALLILLVPYLSQSDGGSSSVATEETSSGLAAIEFSTFQADMNFEVVSGDDESAIIAPLPVSELNKFFEPDVTAVSESSMHSESNDHPSEIALAAPDGFPASQIDDLASEIDSAMDSWLQAEAKPSHATTDLNSTAQTSSSSDSDDQQQQQAAPMHDHSVSAQTASAANAPRANIAGNLKEDFANRVGSAKQEALLRTGGSVDTEAAVARALKFLGDAQRSDGSWDPIATGGGRERAPLGVNRGGAGQRADTAITGLALLTLIGAGNSHADGQYADHVYRGLSYLIRKQKPDGSLAGDASVYAANYSHGMAALAICETAAITGDPSAVEAARRAIAYTVRMQHPSTGGWRYTVGDPGDLSQAGWQVMVLDAAHRAGIPNTQSAMIGARRFLRSVRVGSAGGLACYRPGEAASRTMTAEALATRLLLGEAIPSAELAEAEQYLLQEPPGVGQDNYYYWYYATLALHQLQDESWSRWNQSLQRRLLATQRPDGSWPTTSVWGGYGGSIYTTSMAALCLEAYYRHTIRSDQGRIAGREVPYR